MLDTLKKKKEFDELFERPMRYKSKNFSIAVKRASDTKFAFITQKKIIPKASARNYTRRVMRSIVQEYLKNKSSGIHCAIIARSDLKKEILTSTFKAIQKELLDLLNQIK